MKRQSKIPRLSGRPREGTETEESDTDTDEVIQGCLAFSFMNRVIWKDADFNSKNENMIY